MVWTLNCWWQINCFIFQLLLSNFYFNYSTYSNKQILDLCWLLPFFILIESVKYLKPSGNIFIAKFLIKKWQYSGQHGFLETKLNLVVLILGLNLEIKIFWIKIVQRFTSLPLLRTDSLPKLRYSDPSVENGVLIQKISFLFCFWQSWMIKMLCSFPVNWLCYY